jgi:hypothetical protein
VYLFEQSPDPSIKTVLHMFDLSVLFNTVMGMKMAFLILIITLYQKVCRF